jgi:exopolyphosphatase/guanosine-5'-triphosphate,3'-diphosphate pyrophosphatase
MPPMRGARTGDAAQGRASRIAVLDIGTNSTRLLVADVFDGRVAEVERRNRVTRLGAGVDLSGQLSAEAVEAVCETIAEYVDLYSELGAHRVEAIATSAVRDASNGAAFIAELRSASRSPPGCSTARRRRASPTSGPPPPGRPRTRPW